MKRIGFGILLFAGVSLVAISCKKNQPAYKIEGDYSGNFEGNWQGNDTIINTGFGVTVIAQDKNKAKVSGKFFSEFEVLVTPNGINIELVSPTEGLTEFLYQGDTEKLTFKYENGGNVANYIGTKQ